MRARLFLAGGGTAMPLVKVKHKYPVTLPPEARKELGLEVGDLLEAQVERGKITLTPKSVVDREIARGLQDIKKGRVRGPFKTANKAIRALKMPPRT
jgi:AbrB family looped-hinge helix DNA binding protein